jgi:UDP-N-acetylmuramate dehydrogenase
MKIQNDFPLSEILWYKIGGRAKYLLTCESREDIVQALAFIKEHKPNKVFVCGLGSNLIFSDNDFDGVVIRIVASENDQDIHVNNDGYVQAFAGEVLDKVIVFAFENHLTGLEWAGGLPGTVGAGVRGNVGAYGGEIKDSLVEAEVLDYSGEEPILKTLSNEELAFVYRGSLIKTQKKMVVISATFDLKKSSDEEIREARKVYTLHKEQRKKNHPLEYPNCGSVFKNLREKEQIEKVLEVYPDLRENIEKKWYGKIAVASLIERFGLKGYRVGNAQVSEKHALFIVNLGGAKASDVLQIIQTIKDKFQTTFGFEPEVEVEIVE